MQSFIIKDIEILEIPEGLRTYRIAHSKGVDLSYAKSPSDEVSIDYTYEEIKLIPYVGEDGVKRMVGLSDKVQSIIGLYMQSFLELQHDSVNIMSQNTRLKKEINKMRNANIWTRIKWLFKGIKR